MNWQMSDESLNQKQLLVDESLFALGNGYLGVRGNFEEGYPENYQTIRGAYVNAFYDQATINYGEKAFGYPETKQKIMNVIDAQSIQIFLGDDAEPFSLFTGEILSYSRKLYFDQGFSERKIYWRSPTGKEIKLKFHRLVSFVHRELFAMELTVEPVTFNGKISIVSTIDGAIHNFSDQNDSRVASADETGLDVISSRTEGDHSIVLDQTHTSGLQVACVSSLESSVPSTKRVDSSKESVDTTLSFELTQPVTITKRSIYTDTRRHGEHPDEKGVAILKELRENTFSEMLEKQHLYLNDFWKTADIIVEGDSLMQEGIRFNLFHLLQSAGRDKFSSIAAKGLSGEGYEGHFFWDTEIFMLPFFTLTNPDLARHLLRYRYTTLEYALARARAMGHQKGALFAWRTITGAECSAFFPAGTAQYHISADIAYSCVQYYLATGDLDFIKKYGFEIIAETARLWIEVGHYSDGYFRIDDVTGPDEYTAIVNNNYYTNVMAKFNLMWAAKTYHLLKMDDPGLLQELADRLQLSDDEAGDWNKASKAMYLPYDGKLKINPQDDTFLQKKVWDFENTPKDHYPLLLHYHPLTIYRCQVCKQADTVLAHFLLEEEQDLETIRHSYDYYEKITTHDSSLSTCIFSIMASRLGNFEKAYHYFSVAARIDADNTQGNTKDGLHLANMGGTWMAVVFGFAGVRIKEHGLTLRPSIPEKWNRYAFHIAYRGTILAVEINRDSVNLSLEKGEKIQVQIYDHAQTIFADHPITIALEKNF
ncbi:glycoside hydrolase family 65 protein [Sporolactobacillus shoreae]|uniref:Glycoside hydrolase family 65 protein n=1 Tax=Sporolactobacillus shoreae TaxID=1465501 RepID=A0A4Z0GH33_9BACL|nr:glycosyl hydrolase family 65 protein [Sporolactobacillus shoreae]TGA95935.1 glycoside hydrolase family 65 protein [Sporolactobacillus shoreae]